jgi:cholesterol oxidase
MKNYLYFAEKGGVEVRPQTEVTDIRPLPSGRPDGARYEVMYRRSTAWFLRPARKVCARNVVVSAGVLGTLRLLFNCRDVNRSLPELSPRLGDMVRTNSEALLGSMGRSRKVDYSKGIAITSIIHADEVTCIEPVRYPNGSSFMRLVSGPLMEKENIPMALLKFGWFAVRHPMDFSRAYILPGWSGRTTILLVMQTIDNHMRLRLGRVPLTLFRLGLVAEQDAGEKVPVRIDVAHKTARRFAEKTGGRR